MEKSDVLIVLSPDNCEMHEELCQNRLCPEREPMWTRPLLRIKKQQEAIFKVAEAHNTPCYSTSALRFASEYEALKGRKSRQLHFGDHMIWKPTAFITWTDDHADAGKRKTCACTAVR